MASIFGHAVAAIALGQSFTKPTYTWKLMTLGMLCAMLPDTDVIGFKYDIAYESFWGHRGFSHSLLFALGIGILVTFIFYTKKCTSITAIALIGYFSICTASHGILDAMTTGGLGVAFFSPFNDTRYFLPWRPIQVSPIGIHNFFGSRGFKVIASELIWIGIPSIGIILITYLFKKLKKKNSK